jgi:hypothetical protein
MGNLKRWFGRDPEKKLAQGGTGGRMSQRPVFFVVGVKSGDAREAGGRLGGFGEIFVAFQTHGDADFRFRGRRVGRGGRPDYPQNVAAAAYRHAFAQSDLGGHAQREFDFGAFGERSAGEEEDSAGTEVLGEADAFNGGSGLTKRERKKVREPLADTAFNPNWRSGHSRVTSLMLNRRKRRRYFSSRGAGREVISCHNRK